MREPETEELLGRANRALPFSDEAEKGLLSCLLQNPTELVYQAQMQLPVEAMHHPGNAAFYSVLLEMTAKGIPLDIVTVTNQMRDKNTLHLAGGEAGVSAVFTFVVLPSHFAHYCGIVRDKWVQRQIIAAAAESIEDAQQYGQSDADAGVDSLAARCEGRFWRVLEQAQKKKGGAESRTITSGEMTAEWTENFERIVANRGKTIGIQTGWHDVDRTFHGLAPDADGDFLLIGGFPGSGKTGCFVTLLESIAIDQGWPTLAYPLEMGRVGVCHRLYLGRAGVNVSVSRSGFISKDDFGPIVRASKEISPANVHWGHQSSLSAADLRAEVTMMHRQHGIKCVMIDHFGQLRPSSRLGKNDKIAGQIEIMETIHDLRRNLGILFILFVQLDKAAREKQAKNRPPGNGDVRGASEMIEYPTHIGFIHRPDEVVKWNQLDEKKQETWMGMTHGFRIDCPEVWCDGRGLPDAISVAKIDYEEHARFVITKNRWGPTTDEICLRYRKELQRFQSRATKIYSNNPKYRQVKLPGF